MFDMQVVVQELNQSDFLQHLNSSFQLKFDTGEPIELVLSEVSPVAIAHGQEIFSLEFRGPSESVLPQQTYRMDHDVLGSLDLMIVPVRQDRDGIFYEAVFNRLTQNQ